MAGKEGKAMERDIPTECKSHPKDKFTTNVGLPGGYTRYGRQEEMPSALGDYIPNVP